MPAQPSTCAWPVPLSANPHLLTMLPCAHATLQAIGDARAAEYMDHCSPLHNNFNHQILSLQAMGDARAAEYMRGRRIMEVNPQHPIIQSLKSKVEVESR